LNFCKSPYAAGSRWPVISLFLLKSTAHESSSGANHPVMP
jgi:hypothetical protein